MNKLTIPAQGIEVDYPSGWDEVRTEHAERIGEIMYKAFCQQIDYDIARKMAIDVFIRRVNARNKPVFDEKSVNYWANEAQLAESVNWMFESREQGTSTSLSDRTSTSLSDRTSASLSDQEQRVFEINPKFCTNLIPRVKIGWWKYEGPKDLLADVTIWQFKEVSWRIGKFATTREERYLDEIFCILYLKPKLDKLDYLDNYRLRKAKRVSIGIKFMVYLFFLGCMNWIREETVEIDGQGICFGCLFPKHGAGSNGHGAGSKEQGDNTGMTGILFQMAESGVFGNMEQTSKVNMWDVFLRLYQIHQQIKKVKQ